MKAGWRTVPMGELCTIKNGKSDTQDAVDDGEFAFFDRSKKIKRSSQYLFDCEALIIPGEGTEFLPRHFSGKFDLHQRAYALFEPIDKLDIRYLYHYLHYRSDYFPTVAVGATVKSLRMRHFEKLPVQLTNLQEQQRIVAILDEACEGLATAAKNVEKNLSNARELFECHLQIIFVQQDASWVYKRLGDLASFRNGINFTKSSKGEAIEIVGVRNFKNHFHAQVENLDSVITEGSLPDSDLLKKNDVLFVRSNGNLELIGRCILIGELERKTTFSGFTIRARLEGDSVTPEYLCHFLKSKTARKTMIDGGNGVNIKSLNQTTLSNLVIPYPPSVKDQKAVVDKLEDLFSYVQSLESVYQQKFNALAELKKSILHQAFTGQLQ
ncbi:restriction endonuclease subunit S [Polaromonas sp.]|uniref:restriction endonuclease subunit S n=1 Tax=Polaromonas sp. TaxID=1869339 RepID=UPI0013B76D65|nr:restriction endonuclease subunit S [Polaromonas sp.]NDP63460.1 hypothetical protein [Polaromonas sp.]